MFRKKWSKDQRLSIGRRGMVSQACWYNPPHPLVRGRSKVQNYGAENQSHSSIVWMHLMHIRCARVNHSDTGKNYAAIKASCIYSMYCTAL